MKAATLAATVLLQAAAFQENLQQTTLTDAAALPDGDDLYSDVYRGRPDSDLTSAQWRWLKRLRAELTTKRPRRYDSYPYTGFAKDLWGSYLNITAAEMIRQRASDPGVESQPVREDSSIFMSVASYRDRQVRERLRFRVGHAILLPADPPNRPGPRVRHNAAGHVCRVYHRRLQVRRAPGAAVHRDRGPAVRGEVRDRRVRRRVDQEGKTACNGCTRSTRRSAIACPPPPTSLATGSASRGGRVKGCARRHSSRRLRPVSRVRAHTHGRALCRVLCHALVRLQPLRDRGEHPPPTRHSIPPVTKTENCLPH